jgi:hypothetical protein
VNHGTPERSVAAGVGRLLPWLLLLVVSADWLALRTQALSHPPWVLAVLVAALVIALLGRFVGVTWSLRTRWPHRAAASSAQLLLLGGLLLALGAGFANWARGLQGFVVLHEGETIPLHQGSHLQELETGPLASLEEMDLVITLLELELVPEGDEAFRPRTILRVGRADGEPVRLEVSSRAAAASGDLRFYQGAFGFAPRIVITHEEKTVFDRVVPFTTERRGRSGVSFAGHFTVEKEGLEVRGAVHLPEGLSGHPSLSAVLTREGRPLGRGSLLPGRFAELREGYRLGFAGLKKWSEIDVSRRNFGGLVRLGAGLALLGGVSWPLAWWRGW